MTTDFSVLAAPTDSSQQGSNAGRRTINVRVDTALRQRLDQAALANHRSLSSEIGHRLTQSFAADDTRFGPTSLKVPIFPELDRIIARLAQPLPAGLLNGIRNMLAVGLATQMPLAETVAGIDQLLSLHPDKEG